MNHNNECLPFAGIGDRVATTKNKFETRNYDGLVERPKKNQALFDIIFAPGANGFPSSDLSTNFDHITDPSVCQFIDDNLRKVHHSVGVAKDDAEAFASVQQFNESLIDYTNRLKDSADSIFKKVEE